MKYNPFFRTKTTAIALLLGIFVVIACSDKEDPIGDWDDNIKLSTKHVDFKFETDSILIATEGACWWVEGISFEDSVFQYYNREDIDLESDSYIISEEDFLVERRNKNTLFIKLEENDTRKIRVIKITLQAGNYFDVVTIKQASN
jgi:hypothetical protein